MSASQVIFCIDENGKLSVSSKSSEKPIREYKGKSIIGLPGNYVVIDLETTGISPEYDEIIEISALRYKKDILTESFSSLVKPIERIPRFISKLTGITNSMVASAPNIDNVLKNLKLFLNPKDILLGYNVNFDINFLYDSYENELGEPFKNDFIDVMRLAKRLEKTIQNYKLETLSSYYSISSIHHRSEADCDTCQKCYVKLKEKALAEYGSESEFLKNRSASLKAKDIQASCGNFNKDHPFYEKTIVFTGALEQMVRKDAMQLVVNAGGFVGDGVTTKTNYLVISNQSYKESIKGLKSSKLLKAESLIIKGQDLKIIPESVFYNIIQNQ